MSLFVFVFDNIDIYFSLRIRSRRLVTLELELSLKADSPGLAGADNCPGKAAIVLPPRNHTAFHLTIVFYLSDFEDTPHLILTSQS
jgi:hypothetical protein